MSDQGDPDSRDEIARTLHQLRRDAGMTLSGVAERSGRSSATVSRRGNGRQLPTPARAEAPAGAVSAPARSRRRPGTLAADPREWTGTRQVLPRAGAATARRRYGEIEVVAGHVRTVGPSIAVGPPQTVRWPTPVDILSTHPFGLHDARAVIVGTMTGTAHLTSAAEEGEYVALVRRLGEPAVFGDEAARTADGRSRDHLAPADGP